MAEADPGAHGWSAARLRTLAAVFETFVPGSTEAARHARLAAETLDLAADHDELRLLRLAARSLEWAPANLLLTGVWGRFSRLERERRERILGRWSTHPVARLRTAYQAMRRLGMFLAYADAGDDRDAPRNRYWDRIGYRPAEAVATPQSSLQPVPVERTSDAPLELDADAVIVGSGAGGGVVAARLAAAGRSVLVVEAGIHRSEEEMRPLEAEAYRDLYLDRGTTSTHDLAVTILAGANLGGGTTVNWTTAIDPPPTLRQRWAAVHGLSGFDGAETDEDLARLRSELDLQPPSVIPPKERVLLDGAAALGWEAAPNERNAGPCTDCGACGFGCRRGAKRSGPRGHLAAAAGNGARFLVEAPVHEVLLRNGRAIGVRGRLLADGAQGRPFTVRAPVVVVAAGALRTPLILQRSGLRHPRLGRHLRLHPVVAIAGEYERPMEAWVGPTQAARSMEFLGGGGRATDHPGPEHAGFIIESAPAHPGLMALALPWEGGAASEQRLRRSRYLAPLIALMHERAEGSVGWSRGGHPRIDYRLAAGDLATARRALIEMSRLARAAGAVRVAALTTPPESWETPAGDAGFDAYLGRLARLSGAPNRISLFSAHQLGTARAGADPRTHPVDPDGRVRLDASGSVVGGLYVGDASLFPTPSVVNPMITVMALAERTARAALAGR